MMLPQEGYVLSENFVIVQRFSQTLQAHKLNMIKREKLARHPRKIWRIWACDVTPTSRMPKIVVYQTAPVLFVKNEYFMAKIDVCRSLLPSDRVIGWDIKMTSHPNSNASFINIWDRLISRRSPNLTRSSKLAAAPNWWFLDLWVSLCYQGSSWSCDLRDVTQQNNTADLLLQTD